jgi:hypothetical protein
MLPNSAALTVVPDLGTTRAMHRATPQIIQLRENLSRLSPSHVEDFYRTAHEDCRMVFNRIPNPKAIHTLVQVWKQLWKWRR